MATLVRGPGRIDPFAGLRRLRPARRVGLSLALLGVIGMAILFVTLALSLYALRRPVAPVDASAPLAGVGVAGAPSRPSSVEAMPLTFEPSVVVGVQGGGPLTFETREGEMVRRAGSPLRPRAVSSVESGLRGGERLMSTPTDDLLTPRSVIREIDTRHGGLRAAYERALRDNPKLRGRVDVRFVIEPTGEVQNVAIVRSTLASREVIDDVRETLTRWPWPIPADGKPVAVEYPFVFRPR